MVVYLYILYPSKRNVYIKYDYHTNSRYNIKYFNIRDFICTCIMMVMSHLGELCNLWITMFSLNYSVFDMSLYCTVFQSVKLVIRFTIATFKSWLVSQEIDMAYGLLKCWPNYGSFVNIVKSLLKKPTFFIWPSVLFLSSFEQTTIEYLLNKSHLFFDIL